MTFLKEMVKLDGSGDDEPRVKRTRRVFTRDNYSQFPWAIMLKAEELGDYNSRQANAIRRRFRVPCPFFLAMFGVVKVQGRFPSRAADIAERQ